MNPQHRAQEKGCLVLIGWDHCFPLLQSGRLRKILVRVEPQNIWHRCWVNIHLYIWAFIWLRKDPRGNEPLLQKWSTCMKMNPNPSVSSLYCHLFENCSRKCLHFWFLKQNFLWSFPRQKTKVLQVFLLGVPHHEHYFFLALLPNFDFTKMPRVCSVCGPEPLGSTLHARFFFISEQGGILKNNGDQDHTTVASCLTQMWIIRIFDNSKSYGNQSYFSC